MTSDGMKGPASMTDFVAPAASPAVGTREAMLEKALERIRDRKSLGPCDIVDCNCPSGIAARALAAPVPQQPARDRTLHGCGGPMWICDLIGCAGVLECVEAVESLERSGAGSPLPDDDAPAQQPAQVQPKPAFLPVSWVKPHLAPDRAAQPSDTVGWVECEDPDCGAGRHAHPGSAAPPPGLVPVAEVVRWLGLRLGKDELVVRWLGDGSWLRDLAALDAATKDTCNVAGCAITGPHDYHASSTTKETTNER